MNTQWKMAAYWFIPGVLVGFLLTFMFAGRNDWASPRAASNNTSSEEAEASEQTNEQEQTSSEAVTVLEQPAGHAVIVERVHLSETSWVAVRELDGSGGFGNILGAVRRDAGVHERVVVDLLRATEPDREYAVILFTDDGDKAFDSKADVLVMAADKPLASTFRALVPVGPSGQ